MNKWAIIRIHSTPVFYVETQSGWKPQNMSLRITFIGITNFLCFLVATGRRLQPPSFSGCNLREAPTPQFFGYNQKEATTPYVLWLQPKVATTTYPCPIQPPWRRSRMMEPLSHYHYEIYCCKFVPINLHQTTCTNNLKHAQPCINMYLNL